MNRQAFTVQLITVYIFSLFKHYLILKIEDKNIFSKTEIQSLWVQLILGKVFKSTLLHSLECGYI